jgi:hypothetical protein
MPVKTLPHDPHIRIIIRGLLVSQVIDNSSQAKIGLLRKADGHNKEVVVTKNTRKQRRYMDYSDDFSLLVDNLSGPGIQTFQPSEFERVSDTGDVQDFRWIVDLEKDILRQPVLPHLDPVALKTNFYFNKGVFYTAKKSIGRAVRVQNRKRELLGFVADQMGIAIELAPKSTAVFRNGSKTIFTIDGCSTDRYEIIIDRECQPLRGSSTCRSDFKLLYTAIGFGLKPKELVDLQPEQPKPGEVTLLGTPEVPCFGGNCAS